MYIRNLFLRHFRSYEEISFEFCPHINLIYGPNAKGKTTILEALHLLILGRSFRTPQYQDLIRQDQSSFYLQSQFTKHGIDQMLRIMAEPKERKIIYNSTPITSLSNLLGIVQGVVQTPDDVNLIKGGPAIRRGFLDFQIAQIDPLYVHHLTRYSRAMRQRNQLLRTKVLTTIESWEHEMAQSGAYIVWQRHRTVEKLQSTCQSFYTDLTGETIPIHLVYRTNAPSVENVQEIKEHYLKQYQRNREREKIMGYTLSGPHKDDVLILVEQRDVRHYASEGQQRSCATALHFAEWKNLRQAGVDKPLFMIDDVGMSLDKNRRERLINQLADLGQVFLTSTDSRLLDNYKGESKLFEL